MKFRINDMLTNLNATVGSIIATTSSGGDYFTIGGNRTNMKLGDGNELYVDQDGAHSRYLTIFDSVTNISLNSSGAINVNDHIGEATAYADFGVLGNSNIPIDSEGRWIVEATTATGGMISIGGVKTNIYRSANGGVMFHTVPPVSIDNLLLEDGNDLLQETGDSILLE
jgi:hypothetical protein